MTNMDSRSLGSYNLGSSLQLLESKDENLVVESG